MDQDSIDRIRGATFPLARRGYEKREVERFLGKLADWLEHGGADESRSDLVKRELDRVAQKTGRILAAAEEAAEELRAEAGAEAQEMLAQARAEAEATRAAADKYDTETRSATDAAAERSRVEADTYSRETREEAEAFDARTRKDAEIYAAETREQGEEEAEQLRAEAEREASDTTAQARAEAQRILDEVSRKRDDTETVIADLEARRDGVVGELERLASEVAGTATQHRPGRPPGVADAAEESDSAEREPETAQAATQRNPAAQRSSR
jgi:DivIVA domain-containing protein